MQASSSSDSNRKILLIAIPLVVIVLIALGLGAFFLFRGGNETSTSAHYTGFSSPSNGLIDIAGGGISLKNNKSCIVIILLLLIVLAALFINFSKNKNKQLTEEDINRYSQNVNEARKIANLSDSSRVSDNYASTEENISLPTGLENQIHPQVGNNEPTLDDYYKIQF